MLLPLCTPWPCCFSACPPVCLHPVPYRWATVLDLEYLEDAELAAQGVTQLLFASSMKTLDRCPGAVHHARLLMSMLHLCCTTACHSWWLLP
jgi:hypothetical protein